MSDRPPPRPKREQPRLAEAPAEADIHVIRALKALNNGAATPEQQTLALQWIIETAARTYDQPFRPGAGEGDRSTVFACGRMFVGQQIVKQLNLTLPTLPGAR